jgi:tetratricopeptide (TPR) repeat protein
VRLTVILFLLACIGCLSAPKAAAETIHLKNGRTIWADQVRDKGNQLEYDVGDNTFAIPKSLVDRVEAGGLPSSLAAPGTASRQTADLPALTPALNTSNDPQLMGKIIRDDKVDSDALSAFDSNSNADEAGAAYFIAGRHEFEHGNFSKARTYIERALQFSPDNPTYLNYYASLLVRNGNASQALTYAERSVRNAPDSPDSLTVLGYVQFSADRTKDAIKTWKHSLELRPDPLVEQYLKRAEKESTAESNFSERESNHFVLKFEGGQSSDELRGQLLSVLESDYDDLSRDLGSAPHDAIAVVLYTDQAFFDVTQAPSWTGAVNDGKLRIPIHGITSITPELARVLKHELAHSFINQLASGRCPQWLNEGIAQALEPKQVVNGRLLAAMFKTQHEIPINALEGSFMSMTPLQAAVAYDESLAAVQYIIDSYGISELQHVLQKLSEGSSTEAALRSTIHSDYGQLEASLGQYLNDKYPV